MNKIILACLVALVASQAVLAKPSPRSISDQVAKALGELDKVVQASLNEAEAIINESLETGKAAAGDVIGLVNSEVTKGLEPLKRQVENRKREAEQRGLDTSGCDALIEELDQIVPNLTAEVQVKVDEILDDAEELQTKLLEQIKVIAQIVPDLQKAFEECKNDICLIRILNAVTKDMLTLPIQIGKIASAAIDFALKTTKNATQLARTETRKGLQEGRRLTEEILSCLAAAPIKTTTSEATTTEEPTTTEGPTTTEEPATTEGPTTTQEPATTEEPTTATEIPTTTEEPTTTTEPATTKEPATTENPTTTEESTSTTRAPSTSSN